MELAGEVATLDVARLAVGAVERQHEGTVMSSTLIRHKFESGYSDPDMGTDQFPAGSHISVLTLEDNMPKLTALTVASAVAAATIPSVVIAQGATQTITAFDVQTLGTGLRSSKIVDSQVVNENRETIGQIDDLIISKDIPDIVAIISVGGFLARGCEIY
jgi:hypothetical protein